MTTTKIQILRDALTDEHAWLEAHRKAISKGCSSSWDMGQCDERMNLIDEALRLTEGAQDAFAQLTADYGEAVDSVARLQAELDAQRASVGDASGWTVTVKADRNRVWIINGVQSFMLAHEADTDEELVWYAGRLRDALAGKSAQRAGSIDNMMAECMDMVRGELIEAGIIDKGVPPMMVANAVCAYIERLSAEKASTDIKCIKCAGTGEERGARGYPCPTCDGIGTVEVPALKAGAEPATNPCTSTQFERQNPQNVDGKADAAEPCQNAAHMGEHACANRHQCWEPCGELGHSAEHAKPFRTYCKTCDMDVLRHCGDARCGFSVKHTKRAESEREVFEARGRLIGLQLTRHDDLPDVYSHPPTQLAWEFWQAAPTLRGAKS